MKKTVLLKSFLVLLILRVSLPVHWSNALCVSNPTVVAIWKNVNVKEIKLTNVPYSEYRARYDYLWKFGWRLHDLNVAFSYGEVKYSAVWRQSTAPELQLYEADYQTFVNFQNRYWGSGWRPQIISNYVDYSGNTKYTVVLRQTYENAYMIYEWSQQDFMNEYNRLKVNGWRIKKINTIYKNNQTLYTVIFEQTYAAESWIAAYKKADFLANYNTMKARNWHIHTFDIFQRPDGEIFYTVVWRYGYQLEAITYDENPTEFNQNYYNTTPQSNNWRIHEISIVGNYKCNDLIVIGVRTGEEEITGISDEAVESSLVKVSPNYTETNEFQIVIENANGKPNATMELFDLTGKKHSMSQEVVALHEGTNTIGLKTPEGLKGVFILRTTVGTNASSEKVIIK